MIPKDDNTANTGMARRTLLFISLAAGEGPRAAPLGAAQIIAWLYKQPDIRAAWSIQLLEGLAEDSVAALAGQIAAAQPQVLALSVYSWNSTAMHEIAGLVRAALPEVLIVAGGPEAGGAPETALNSGLADYVICGEAEIGMTDFLRAVADNRLPATDSPAAQRIFRPAAPDLSNLPSPWLDGIIQAENYGGAVWELTRGCPYRCAFCYESRGSGKVRSFAAERVEKELRYFVKHGARELFVLDPVFNADKKRMKQLIQLIRSVAPELFCQFELRAELLTPEQAEWLSSINCQVQLGLQSIHSEVLQKLNRSMDAERFREKVALLEEAGVIYGLDLIFGLPGDSLSGFMESLNYALELRPNHLDVFPLAVLPGTSLAEQAADYRLHFAETAPHVVTGSDQFPAADLEQAARLAAAVELFYNRGRAVMWFMPLCAALDIAPTAVLADFDCPPGHEKLEHREIEQLQQEQRQKLLARHGTAATARGTPVAPGLERLLADLIAVSGAWTRAIAEGEDSQLDLQWLPEDLLDIATVDCIEVLEDCQTKPGCWLCRASDQGPQFSRRKN
ncbi:MAG: radical SAM protein [Spirochaetes bacterium]|nr:radical SAM protein [Spirochaetota bacterium]MBU0956949.1 radical SAM protein [Spirochaetota bacterium]